LTTIVPREVFAVASAPPVEAPLAEAGVCAAADGDEAVPPPIDEHPASAIVASARPATERKIRFFMNLSP
jgi:hypothetical protein